MIDEHFTGRTAYVGIRPKKPARATEAVGHEHQPDCAWWHCKPCDCRPTKIVVRGRRIIREVANAD